MRWRESWRADPTARRLADGHYNHPSSDLALEALSATRFYWEPPSEGMITFIDPNKTRHKRDHGRCFRKAGFHVSGKAPGKYRPVCICDGKPHETEGGLVALHMSRSAMLEAVQPLGAQTRLELG